MLNHVPDSRCLPFAIALTRTLAPTGPECVELLRDLHRHLGKELTASLLHCDQGHITRIIRRQQATTQTRTLVWLIWALVLRTGELRDTFTLATCGRFSARCGPQHVGMLPIIPGRARVGTGGRYWSRRHRINKRLKPDG